jgi:Flp pilus assembly CpaE family ATPase
VVSNGSHPTPKLSVLLSGPAASNVAATLEHQPALAVVGAGEPGGASVDVAVLALHSSSDPNIAEEALRLREVTNVPFVLAAYGEPNGIVEAGLAIGAADVLVMPQPAETLIFALRKAAIAAADSSTGKVVTVFSPKGGSGKTVLATNLAVAAARSGVKTLLVDLDLQFGDSALTLALSPRATISDLAASAGDIDAEKLKAFVTVDSRTGLSVLPSPTRPEEADVVGASELAAVLSAAKSSYDAVVIDTGPLFDGAMLAALDHTDQLLLVCNPEVTSLKNVRIGIETLDRLGFDRARVALVANRIGAPGGVDRGEIEAALDAKVAYELPDDRAVPAAVNRALPVVVSDEGGPFARALVGLLRSVFNAPSATEDAPRPSQRRFLLRGRR